MTSNGTGTGSSSYTWDAEGRLASVDGGATSTYIYNALGQQAEIQLTGPARNFERLYDPAGQELSEFNATSPYYMWTWQNVRVGGKLVDHYWWAGAGSFANFVHLNYLGSTSMVTDYSGATVMDEVRYPWGQESLHSGSRYDEHFAGMSWHDYAVDLDPTLFRMYSSTYGRWMTPDPLAGDVSNPQSLNRYAYVLNNPTNLVDPSGMGPCDRNPDAGVCNHDPNLRDAVGNWDQYDSCYVDGLSTSCGIAFGLIGMDAAVQCPGPCTGFGTNAAGQTIVVQFSAFAGGASGYFYGPDLANGINIVNGMVLTDAGYNKYIQVTYAGAIEAQRQALANAIAANSGGAITYQQAYDALDPATGHLKGGNYDFGYGLSIPNCTFGRCDNGVHFVDGLVHLDSANPLDFPLGTAEHFGVDVFLGNFFYTVIPRH